MMSDIALIAQIVGKAKSALEYAAEDGNHRHYEPFELGLVQGRIDAYTHVLEILKRAEV